MRIKYEPVTKPNGDSYVLITEITGFPTYDECPRGYLKDKHNIYVKDDKTLCRYNLETGVSDILVVGKEYLWSDFKYTFNFVIQPAAKSLKTARKRQKECAQEMKHSSMVWECKEDRVPTEDD